MKWIKVTDKLPPPVKHLLVYSKKWGVCIDFATNADKFSKGSSVTHWMFLPKVPKE